MDEKTHPKFENISISTKTIIAITNFNIDIEKLYNNLPLTNYNVYPKRRGRKRKGDTPKVPQKVDEMSIITVKSGKKIRGVDLKNKKPSVKTACFFRNSITVVMCVDKKFINCKVSKNGKLQLTGCKSQEQAEKFVQYLWKHMNNLKDENGKLIEGVCKISDEVPKTIFLTVMTNIGFNIGFPINREILDDYINKNTKYNSLFETSVGYTGINIKMPIKSSDDLRLKVMYLEEGIWKYTDIFYKNYLDTLPKKEKQREITKKEKRCNTFLVFHSGNIIYSSWDYSFMKDVYEEFTGILQGCKELIVEKLEE